MILMVKYGTLFDFTRREFGALLVANPTTSDRFHDSVRFPLPFVKFLIRIAHAVSVDSYRIPRAVDSLVFSYVLFHNCFDFNWLNLK